MLLQRLADYADQMEELPPPMYQPTAVRYIIRLTEEGRPLGAPIDTADRANRATEKGVRRFVPAAKRTSGIEPMLLADKADYALGFASEGDRPEQITRRHESFVDLVRDCAGDTDEPAVRAVERFLDGPDRVALPLPTDFDPTAVVTFQVGSALPIDLPTVRAFWQQRRLVADAADSPDLQCVICGNVRPALRRHLFKIKGIPNGQTSGTELISANERAYESYGLSNSLIAPTCSACAEKYANALNTLLRSETTHLRVGDLKFAFWTARQVGFDFLELFSNPSQGEVTELLSAVWTGRRAATEIDAAEFYALALSASGARAVVRSWITTTVEQARRRLARYFALQELIHADGTPSTPASLRYLTDGTIRFGGKEQPPPVIAESLVALALNGTPLPMAVLFHAVRRCRAEQKVTRQRAMLIKMVFASHDFRDGRSDTMRGLDESNENPAYVCGRLLAILDSIQYYSLGRPNATLVDKFYGTASSAPASVFGTLLHNTQHHLAKLRKKGEGIALEKRLTQALGLLKEFPRTLTLPEQGQFAIGYYHQRAFNMSGGTAGSESQLAPDASASESDESMSDV
ncbi:MAG: type I-C CRISPR-associated protein Cas8c/Csd1 [Chloroflexota bacterium]|nr:type I-C CRISPR-associated protein Cas8c/Csd1 [Chloroflexota bacterium]